ncbi:MAG: hypothetical protein U0572_11265 [Phycisphaerales bacterium]
MGRKLQRLLRLERRMIGTFRTKASFARYLAVAICLVLASGIAWGIPVAFEASSCKLLGYGVSLNGRFNQTFAVTDETGKVIGNGLSGRFQTAIHFGYLQDGVRVAAPGHVRRAPSWARRDIPAPFTAVSTIATGWPFRWRTTSSWMDHNNLNAGYSPAGHGVVWWGFAADTLFFFTALILLASVHACGVPKVPQLVRALRVGGLAAQLAVRCHLP